MKKLSLLSLFFFIAICFSSCTLCKIVVFFRPNLNDHKKAFVCDTSKANIPEYLTLSVSNSSTTKTKDHFINAHNPSNIPPINQWVLKEQRQQTGDLDKFLKKTKTRAFIVN